MNRNQEIIEGAGNNKWTKKQETGMNQGAGSSKYEGAGSREWTKEQETGSEKGAGNRKCTMEKEFEVMEEAGKRNWTKKKKQEWSKEQ